MSSFNRLKSDLQISVMDVTRAGEALSHFKYPQIRLSCGSFKMKRIFLSQLISKALEKGTKSK